MGMIGDRRWLTGGLRGLTSGSENRLQATRRYLPTDRSASLPQAEPGTLKTVGPRSTRGCAEALAGARGRTPEPNRSRPKAAA